jgi:hypothetical protein
VDNLAVMLILNALAIAKHESAMSALEVRYARAQLLDACNIQESDIPERKDMAFISYYDTLVPHMTPQELAEHHASPVKD